MELLAKVLMQPIVVEAKGVKVLVVIFLVKLLFTVQAAEVLVKLAVASVEPMLEMQLE